MPRRVLVTEPIHKDALNLLTDAGWEVLGPDVPMQAADALLVRVRPVSEADIRLFSMISKHGVGVDNIPLRAAETAGVTVMNTPGANAGAVAEQALMLMLALLRNLPQQLEAALTGQASPLVRGLEGRRLLVIGYGASGRKIAALGKALGMGVTVHSRSMNDARHAGFDVATNLDAALKRADIVSFHCPLTDDTRHMLNAQRLSLMPKGAIVVNCARGGLIEEAALGAALVNGELAGAALDVTEMEPLPSDHPLRDAPNLILTPHAAAMSDGAFRRMGMMAAQNILDHFAGRGRAEFTVVSVS
jgi:D-3-phosphoglycerate dehydrogenase